jgi:hypothetical protein
VNETMTDSRARQIQERLDAHFIGEVEVAVATPEPAWWAENHPTVGSWASLGWGSPVPNSQHDPAKGTSAIIVPYCPEVIDEQTAGLTDEELDEYLGVVVYVTDMHITYWAIEDIEQRHQIIMEELGEQFPASARLIEDQLEVAALLESLRGL